MFSTPEEKNGLRGEISEPLAGKEQQLSET